MYSSEIKREDSKLERGERTPLTPPNVLCLLCLMPLTNYNNTMLQAAFTLAFAGFRRVGELTYKKSNWELGASFSKWFLTKPHISMTRDMTYLESKLPALKTDPFRKGITLTIATSHDAGCPVAAMRRVQEINSHCPRHVPLFCVDRYKQHAFTMEYIARSLQQISITAGLGHGCWTGHSFQRGVATLASEVGITETEIQILGRWRSDAYKTYIEYSLAERIPLFKRFQQRPHQ